MKAWIVIAGLLLAACGGGSGPDPEQPTPGQRGQAGPPARRVPPALPDTLPFGVHVLALGVDEDGGIWAGTYGQGIFVMRPGAREWEQLVPRPGQSSTLASAWINSLGFAKDGSVWYGSVGGGFGRSVDGGRTWRNWSYDELGPQWLYVAHNGIRTQGDTVVIGTSDGLRITRDAGNTWLCVVAAEPVDGGGDGPETNTCTNEVRTLPTDYVLSVDIGPDGSIWAGHLTGLSMSKDGGRTWRHLGEAQGIPAVRIRAVSATPDTMVWVASEDEIFVDSLYDGKFKKATIRLPGWPGLPGRPRAIVPTPGVAEPSLVTSFGLAAGNGLGDFRIYFVAAGDEYRPAADMWTMTWTGPPLWPVGGSATGLARVLAGEGPRIDYSRVRPAAAPVESRHVRFRRPIADSAANPYIDATYRYGETMGGTFPPHQGVEFNNPAGTPVRAVAAGVVVFAGEAEAGSLALAIRHDVQLDGRTVYSAYHHNSRLEVRNGDRVEAGEIIARVGNTGRATTEHLHLEIHVAPQPDDAAIVGPNLRNPPHTVNPELWLEPMPGTGTVAGRVLDAAGRPVGGARVFGLVLPYPAETPFSWAETYSENARSDPAWGENFAVSDVPVGTYLLGVDVGEERIWRRIRVEAGKVTFVEFRPGSS